MLPINGFASAVLRAVRACGSALLLSSLFLGGCKWIDWRGEGFEPDRTFDSMREMRPVDRDNEFWGFSNKSRQIERNVGIGDR